MVGVSEYSSGTDEIIGGGGGNRWPKQETMALIRIRSDLDFAFSDQSRVIKTPLWDQVSRKMGELGFQRSAKKCKEKFENVYKYHKRTKDGRGRSKPDGKTYRFFDQLQALQSSPRPLSFAPPATTTMEAPTNTNIVSSSISPNPLSVAPPKSAATQIGAKNEINSSFQPTLEPPLASMNGLNPRVSRNSTSTSTSSDEDILRSRGKKRKWKDFFERLMKDVFGKQDEMQRKFLETLEKRERDRIAREESWRMQEMSRMNREHELLVQERSVAATKDTALITFLQKVSGNQQNNFQVTNSNNTYKAPSPSPPPPPPTQEVTVRPLTKTLDITKKDNGGSSSRWPKSEIEALITLRSNLELKYHENAAKGPLWEDISSAMAKLGYNRSSKRCKEKWENINKYYKKVKDQSSKKRAEDSKTCPYFHQLEAMYKEKAKNNVVPSVQQQDLVMDDQDRENDSDVIEDDDKEDEGEEEEEGGGYGIVQIKPASKVTNVVE